MKITSKPKLSYIASERRKR